MLRGSRCSWHGHHKATCTHCTSVAPCRQLHQSLPHYSEYRLALPRELATLTIAGPLLLVLQLTLLLLIPTTLLRLALLLSLAMYVS